MNAKKSPVASQVTHKKNITPLFFEGLPAIPAGSIEEDKATSDIQTEIIKTASSINNGSLFVIDLRKRSFVFVSEHDLFLSGFSSGDVLNMGYEFFPKTVHPDDLALFIRIHCIILKYLLSPDCDTQEIDYFAFNYRLLNHGQPLMVYQKMAFICTDGYPTKSICQLYSSAIRNVGNLELLYKNKNEYSSYSFKNHRWQRREILKLTDREKDILKLAKQGNSSKEIADKLCTAEKTIRNTETGLYQKLGVHSMLEATTFATNHHLIFV
jgi:DNA-binding CsgD family transcriptional regulator